MSDEYFVKINDPDEIPLENVQSTVISSTTEKRFIPGEIKTTVYPSIPVTPIDPTQVTTPIAVQDVEAVYGKTPKHDREFYYTAGIACTEKLQSLLKDLGKAEVALSTKKAQQKLVYYRHLGVAAADKTNTNDKARDAACFTKLELDAWYCQLASEIASCEENIESLKADVVYYKSLILFNLAMTGMRDGNIFWS